jgi:hypothetical protein
VFDRPSEVRREEDMTEGRFFRQAALASTGVTLLILVVDRAIPHDPIPVAPFGEPWLTMVGSIGIWLAAFVASHVGRWIYLIVLGREPDLGR